MRLLTLGVSVRITTQLDAPFLQFPFSIKEKPTLSSNVLTCIDRIGCRSRTRSSSRAGLHVAALGVEGVRDRPGGAIGAYGEIEIWGTTPLLLSHTFNKGSSPPLLL